MKKKPNYTKVASRAHCDLNMFYAVIALMENGLVSADRYRSAQRIIKICQAESGRCLRDYDRAIAALKPPAAEGSR